MKKVIYTLIALILISGGYYVISQNNKTKSLAYRIGLASNLESYNPVKGVTSETIIISSQLNDTLYAIDGDRLLLSGASEEPTISDDQTKYTFKLKENYWVNSKGEKQNKILASDYEYSFKQLANPENKSEYASLLVEGNIKNASQIIKGEKGIDELGVKAINDNTLEFTLNIPTPYFKEYLAFSKFTPISKQNVEAKGSLDAAFKTYEDTWYSGAYYISNEKLNEEYKMSKNNHFHDAKNVAVEKVELKVIKDIDTIYKEFESGNLDQATIPNKEQIEKRASDKNVKKIVRGGTNYLALNQTSPVMQNINVRKTIQMGVNYDKIVNEVLNNGTKATNQFSPVGLTKAVYDLEYTDYVGKVRTYDLEKAKEYAKNAKNELGEQINFKFLAQDNAVNRKFAEAVQAELKQNFEFNVELEFIVQKEYFAKARKDPSSYDMMFARWTGDYADPATFMSVINMENKSLNFSRNNDTKLLEMIKEAQNEFNPNSRLEKFAKAEKYAVLEQAYVIPYEQRGVYVATNGKFDYESTLLKVELYRFVKIK